MPGGDAAAAVEESLDHIHPDLRALARPIAGVELDPKNARKHNRRNLDAIKESLARFGCRAVLIAQRNADGTLVMKAGNGRITVARELGWTHMPILVFDEDDAESMAHAIADNQTALLAEWDFTNLTTVLEELKGFDVDGLLDSTGFSGDEVDSLLRQAEAARTPVDPSKKMENSGEGSTQEIDLDGFSDDAFAHQCPRCSFRFNESGKTKPKKPDSDEDSPQH